VRRAADERLFLCRIEGVRAVGWEAVGVLGHGVERRWLEGIISISMWCLCLVEAFSVSCLSCSSYSLCEFRIPIPIRAECPIQSPEKY